MDALFWRSFFKVEVSSPLEVLLLLLVFVCFNGVFFLFFYIFLILIYPFIEPWSSDIASLILDGPTDQPVQLACMLQVAYAGAGSQLQRTAGNGLTTSQLGALSSARLN
jgi:hypothetical protein